MSTRWHLPSEAPGSNKTTFARRQSQRSAVNPDLYGCVNEGWALWPVRGRCELLCLRVEGELGIRCLIGLWLLSNTCRNGSRISVGSERSELVAHAVTNSSATPIILETATRASPVFRDG
ncbi:hypothetical protein VTL71DRAFT_5797 [Oculimacula yallundae]|uniref:Uncharacterized protein n=1 Tax=Oculimacula yallundae TaxID=86028 RepID=A0ABR4BYJ6_9HELO